MSQKRLRKEKKRHYTVDVPNFYNIDAKWYGKNEKVRVHGYNINGFVYVGKCLSDYEGYNDVCLIDPTKPIERSGETCICQLTPGYDCYELLEPHCRNEYLKWLSSGFKENINELLFIYLYFSGLERRLFLDGSVENMSDLERFSLVNEVLRLFELYKSNLDVILITARFLAVEWALRGFLSPPPKLVLSEFYPSTIYSFVIPLQYAHNAMPLPSEEALKYGFYSLSQKNNHNVSVNNKDLKNIFSIRYKQRFDEGAMLSPSGKWRAITPLRIWNCSLKNLNMQINHFPDEESSDAPLVIIKNLLRESRKELNSYLKCWAINRKLKGSLELLLKTPFELIEEASGFEKMKSCLVEGCARELSLTWTEFLKLITFKSGLEYKASQAIKLAKMVGMAGFAFFPDPRYIKIKIEADTRFLLVNFSESDFSASLEYLRMNMVIVLGTMAFKIFNDRLTKNQYDILSALIINNQDLSSPEKKSLFFFLRWCDMEKWRFSPTKKKDYQLNEKEKTAIIKGLFLEKELEARINAQVLQKLNKAYEYLGLSKEQISSDMHRTIVSQDISDVRNNDAALEFKLDQAAIEQGLNETAQVKLVLEEVFVDEEEEDEKPQAVVSALDSAHERLLQRLIEKELWNRGELEKICVESSLFLDSALENINDWFFDKTNSLLVEEWGNFYVDLEKAGEFGFKI